MKGYWEAIAPGKGNSGKRDAGNSGGFTKRKLRMSSGDCDFKKSKAKANKTTIDRNSGKSKVEVDITNKAYRMI